MLRYVRSKISQQTLSLSSSKLNWVAERSGGQTRARVTALINLCLSTFNVLQSTAEWNRIRINHWLDLTLHYRDKQCVFLQLASRHSQKHQFLLFVLSRSASSKSMHVYITTAPFLLVFALYVAQIIQIYGDDDGVENTKYDYEILKVAKYISSLEKREKSHSKGECTNRQYFEINLQGKTGLICLQIKSLTTRYNVSHLVWIYSCFEYL